MALGADPRGEEPARGIHDVAIVGGGPVGLALAIGAAAQGLAVVVFERQRYPVDKACGEGLMPTGLRLLEALGVRCSPADCTPFTGIRYLQEDGSTAEGSFGEGRFGLGIRRTALSTALVERAREAGAEIREGVGARGWSRHTEGVQLETDGGPVHARLLVAADGLNSTLRQEQGLERPSGLPARYGLRRHYALAPWTDRVEVYFSRDVEAYVTPVGERRIGVAFLWERGSEQVSFEQLLERFPKLAQRLGAAPHDSTVRGAGPLARTVPVLAQDRFVLLGDAAGYVDAITGEGLTLGLRAAAFLAAELPAVLAQGATARSLDPYVRACARHFDPYSRMTRAMLWLARRPALRRRVIRAVGRAPWAFDQLLRRVA